MFENAKVYLGSCQASTRNIFRKWLLTKSCCPNFTRHKNWHVGLIQILLYEKPQPLHFIFYHGFTWTWTCQRQRFTDALQSKCSEKFRNIQSKTTMMKSFLQKEGFCPKYFPVNFAKLFRAIPDDRFWYTVCFVACILLTMHSSWVSILQFFQ